MLHERGGLRTESAFKPTSLTPSLPHRPQIDFGAPFPPFFASLLKHKLSSYPNVLREVSLGKRFTATDLQAAGLVDEIVPALGLRTRGIEFGNKVGLKSAQGPWGLIKVSSTTSFSRRYPADNG